MRASKNRVLLSMMAGCLLMTSVVVAQQGPTHHASSNVATTYGMTGQAEDQYVPQQPQTIYTNTNYQVVDPLAEAESAYPHQLNGQGTYSGFHGDQYDFGYQPSYSYQLCEPSYCPGLTCGQWFVTGWLDQGFTYNTDKPRSRTNGPLKFNDRSNEYQLNQIYLSMGRSVANSGCSWDVGGRVDLLYGSDYLWTSAIGLETHTTYASGLSSEDPSALPSQWNSNDGPRAGGTASRFGLAMPQLYAEMYIPVHCGLNIKAGHFYSIMGYESVMSPQNFFYSHSYTMMYGQPMTHTGILFSQRLTHRLTGIFGVTRGWDTWEDPNGKLSYLAGFRWNSWDRRTEFSWVAASGNETVTDKFGGTGNSTKDAIRSHYSMVLSHQLTPRLKLVAQHDLGYEKYAAYESIDYIPQFVNGHWYSVSGYAFYQLTEKLTFGIRGEWFRDVNSGRIYRDYPIRTVDNRTTTQLTDGSDYSQVTVGLNWKPYNCLVIRPEARWDWSGVCKVNTNGTPTGIDGMYNGKSQTTIALSTYITY
ncbi:MAG: porin [Planctomycetaceae bacterium]|nr:porin [Planctomycetaceae bacterium]